MISPRSHLANLEAPTGCWLQESVDPGFSSCIAGIVYGVHTEYIYGIQRWSADVCVVCHG